MLPPTFLPWRSSCEVHEDATPLISSDAGVVEAELRELHEGCHAAHVSSNMVSKESTVRFTRGATPLTSPPKLVL